MANLAQKCIFLHRQRGQLFVGIAQLTGGAFQLGRFYLKLVGVFQHLSRLIGHGHELFHGNRGAARNLPHHRVGRRRTDRARQTAFKYSDEVWRDVGQISFFTLLSRHLRKEPLCITPPNDALRHHKQIFRLNRGTAPATRFFRKVKHIHKCRSLQALNRIGETTDRGDNESRRVQQHCPEDRMHNRIKARHTKQRIWAQPLNSEKPIAHDTRIHVRIRKQRRQQQRIHPNAEPHDQAKGRTGTRAAAPKKPTDQRRQHLGNPYERDEADGRQRHSAARNRVIDVAQQQHRHDRQPTRHQHHRTHIARYRGPDVLRTQI